MALSALIFDVDGTLAENEELHRHAFNRTFADEGLSWFWDRALYARLLLTTGGKERMRAFIRDHAPVEAPDDAEIPRIHAAKTETYAQLVAEGALALRPGIAGLIARARRGGLKLAVATTTNRPNVDALSLACFDAPADAVFDVIAAGDEVAAKKPAPDVYLLALARLGLPPGTCVAFEDSRNGLLSAKAAGIPCVVSPGPYTAGQDFGGAALVLDCFSQTPTLDRLADRLGRAA